MRASVVFATLAVALAAAPARGDWSAEVALASNFVHRGFTRSDGEPVVQAGLSYRTRSGLVAALWGSSVRFAVDDSMGEKRRVELQGVVGWAPVLSDDWSLATLLRRYEYPGVDSAFESSYTEAEFAVLYRRLLRVGFTYTDDFLGGGSTARFFELSGRLPAPRLVDLTAGLGAGRFAAGAGALDYSYGHVGVARSVKSLDLELGYYRADSRPVPSWGGVADGSWVLSISMRRERFR